MGIVLLIGVVVNNGIVLIDYTNRLRADGRERREALMKAAERRFRPIMTTAFTTICRMVPVTLSGASSLGLSYTSFGLTLRTKSQPEGRGRTQAGVATVAGGLQEAPALSRPLR